MVCYYRMKERNQESVEKYSELGINARYHYFPQRDLWEVGSVRLFIPQLCTGAYLLSVLSGLDTQWQTRTGLCPFVTDMSVGRNRI